jgi:hypothetical protein
MVLTPLHPLLELLQFTADKVRLLKDLSYGKT